MSSWDIRKHSFLWWFRHLWGGEATTCIRLDVENLRSKRLWMFIEERRA